MASAASGSFRLMKILMALFVDTKHSWLSENLTSIQVLTLGRHSLLVIVYSDYTHKLFVVSAVVNLWVRQ